MSELLIRNAAAVATGDVHAPFLAGPTDIRIVDGRIGAIASGAAGRADSELDASGLLVMPGLWDGHHHPYFGDHTPQFDARGYLAETVRGGTTTIVSAGTIDFPGRPHDAAGERELAILSQRSWIHDRPLEINVLSGAVVAAESLLERDFAALARAGVRRLVVRSPLPTAAEARRQVAWARARGFTVVAHADGPVALVRDAGSVEEALAVIDPDVVLAVNGGDVALADAVIDRLIGDGHAALECSLTGNYQVARRVVAALVARGEPERVVLGTETPSRRGVVPHGMQRMLQHVIGADPAVTAALAIAFASGNVARAFAAPGGRIAVGEPADLLLCGAPSPDPLRALARGEWLEIHTVLIAGSIEHARAAAVTRTPALVGAR